MVSTLNDATIINPDLQNPNGLAAIVIPVIDSWKSNYDHFKSTVEKLRDKEGSSIDFSALEPLLRHVLIELRLVLEIFFFGNEYVRSFGIKDQFKTQLELLTYKNAEEIKELAAKFLINFPLIKIDGERGIQTYEAVFAIIQKEIDLRPDEEGSICIQITEQDIRKLADLLHQQLPRVKDLPFVYKSDMTEMLEKFGIIFTFVKETGVATLEYDLPEVPSVPEVLDSPLGKYIAVCEEIAKSIGSSRTEQQRFFGVLIELMKNSQDSFTKVGYRFWVSVSLVLGKFNELRVGDEKRKYVMRDFRVLITHIGELNGLKITLASFSPSSRHVLFFEL